MFPQMRPDHEKLREETIGLIAAKCPPDQVRRLFDHPIGFEVDYHLAGARLGWHSLVESDITAAVAVAYERGLRIQPGPFRSINIVVSALAPYGADEHVADVLGQLRSGHATAAWALNAVDLAVGVVADEIRGGGFTLSGVVPVVPDASRCEWLLVPAWSKGRLVQLLVPARLPGITVTPLECFDLTARMAEVRFESVIAAPETVLPDSGEVELARQVKLAALLSAADCAGAMDGLFAMTRNYSLERVAFGRPIGSFQALKHRMADMSMLVECSKSLVVVATDAVDADRESNAEQVSIAKAFVGDSAIDVSQGCLQIHGGVGYTWDHDLHLYFRRLTQGHGIYGRPDQHRDLVLDAHGV